MDRCSVSTISVAHSERKINFRPIQFLDTPYFGRWLRHSIAKDLKKQIYRRTWHPTMETEKPSEQKGAPDYDAELQLRLCIIVQIRSADHRGQKVVDAVLDNSFHFLYIAKDLDLIWPVCKHCPSTFGRVPAPGPFVPPLTGPIWMIFIYLTNWRSQRTSLRPGTCSCLRTTIPCIHYCIGGGLLDPNQQSIKYWPLRFF